MGHREEGALGPYLDTRKNGAPLDIGHLGLDESRHVTPTSGRFGSAPRALTGGIAVLVLLAAAACSSGTTGSDDAGTQTVDLNANPAAHSASYWKKVSWENVSSVDADVAFVYHDVANASDVKLADIPSRYPGFDTISAVEKQQMVLWDYGANKSYSRYTNTIDVYADALSKAQKVTAE